MPLIGRLVNLSVHFTLHTDPRAEVPEFTISCRTYGGPATEVIWVVNEVIPHEGISSSQVILDTSQNSVYDNRLRVNEKRAGNYLCTIMNTLESSVDHEEIITSIIILFIKN